MTMLHFKTELYTIGKMTILRLPKDESAKLPTRGQTMVAATINGYDFKTPLEPDGNWSHWLEVSPSISKSISAKAGDTVTVGMEPIKEWSEPAVPEDIMKAVKADAKAYDLWQKITPLARWEWVRWVRGTNSQETRSHRVEVAVDKLRKGMRRPCCWNRNACSVMSVTKGGVLLEPAMAQ